MLYQEPSRSTLLHEGYVTRPFLNRLPACQANWLNVACLDHKSIASNCSDTELSFKYDVKCLNMSNKAESVSHGRLCSTKYRSEIVADLHARKGPKHTSAGSTQSTVNT